MTCLYIHPPVHYPAPSLSLSPWSFTVGRPGMDSEMDIEFSPLEIFDEKEAEASNKHSVWTVCKIGINLSLTCEEGPQHLVLAEKA